MIEHRVALIGKNRRNPAAFLELHRSISRQRFLAPTRAAPDFAPRVHPILHLASATPRVTRD
jgi:hypothetical protein